MLDLHSIEFENFKSFRGKHQFVFPTTDGLYFITGDNTVEPRLGSNGAGKSTFLDAIYWCLYGKTLRGLKASDVVTWGEKGCSVTIHLNCAHVTVPITRKQNPNSLELDGRLVDQEAVTKYIGLNEDSFIYSVILPQFGQSFFELTPTNKLGLFSQILNLDKWLERSQKAAVKAAVLETMVKQGLQRAQSAVEGTEALREELSFLATKEATFAEERKVFENQIEQEIDAADLSILDLKDLIKKATKELEGFLVARDKKVVQLNSIEAAYEKHLERRGKNTNVCMLAKAKLDVFASERAKLNKLEGTCPTCYQKVDIKHLQGEIKRIDRAEAQLEKEYADARQAHNEAEKFITKAKNDLGTLSKTINSIDAECTASRVSITTAEAEIRLEKDRISRLNQQLKDEQNQKNPYTEIIAGKLKDVDTLTAKIKQYRSEAAKTGEEQAATNFWVAGFKRVRLFLIEETLKAFELEVNNSLATLGLTDWKVEFDIERENKSGGITKGFTVFVTNARHHEPVRFEAWSGGEAQRLQLAGDLGLANLIMLQAGLRNTIEFYDEPSKHLSRAGLLDLAETLHQRAITEQKRIMLIDHQTIEFGEFADVIKIVKTENGSEITTNDH